MEQWMFRALGNRRLFATGGPSVTKPFLLRLKERGSWTKASKWRNVSQCADGIQSLQRLSWGWFRGPRNRNLGAQTLMRVRLGPNRPSPMTSIRHGGHIVEVVFVWNTLRFVFLVISSHWSWSWKVILVAAIFDCRLNIWVHGFFSKHLLWFLFYVYNLNY